MKSIITIFLLFVINISFSQVRIIYRTVFNQEEKRLTNTEFILTINVDKETGTTSYSFSKYVKESEFQTNFTVNVDKGQAIFNKGHIGMLYMGVDYENNYYIIQMMDDYCIIKYLPKGKTSMSDAITWFTLMDGE